MNHRHFRWRITLLLLAGALVACRSAQREDSAKNSRTTLRVAMFPYLPSLGKQGELARRIEQDFETLHPDVDLELQLDPGLNYYDPFLVAGWLKSRTSDGRPKQPFDLVEIDTVLLGTLVDMEAVSEWPNEPANLIRTAYEAACLDGRQYGVPHWMCGHFIVTKDPVIAGATSISELTAAMKRANTPHPNLVGNLAGSWNTAAIYLDAWVDSGAGTSPSSALRLPLDSTVVNELVSFASQGMNAGANPCIDGTFDDDAQPELAAKRFGAGNADALFGYSERLHVAQRYGLDPSSVFVRSAPLGRSAYPLWFVDAWVAPVYDDEIVPTSSQLQRRDAARKFVAYMNAPSTFEWIHLHADATCVPPVPRYLIPATISAYEGTALARDPVMKQIRPLLDTGTFFPQYRLPGLRRALSSEVRSAWEAAVK